MTFPLLLFHLLFIIIIIVLSMPMILIENIRSKIILNTFIFSFRTLNYKYVLRQLHRIQILFKNK